MHLMWQRPPPANYIYSSSSLSKFALFCLTVLAYCCTCYQVADQVLQPRTMSLAAYVSIVEKSQPYYLTGVANQHLLSSLIEVLKPISSSR